MIPFLLAFSLNIDSLTIGVNYGLRKIKISFLALLIIVSMSVGAIAISWFMGHIIFSYISIYISKIVCSALLILLGVFLLTQAIINIYYPLNNDECVIKKIKIRPFKIVINIAREPSSADIDHSGIIDYKEAIYIGSALSIDALTIGLSLAGYGIDISSFLVLTAVLNFSFLVSGQLIGRFVGKFISEDKLKLAASLTIIILGFAKLT